MPQEKENWTDIHEDFGKKEYPWIGKTYQQEWEERGFAYQEAKEWIAVGLELNEYKLVAYARWKNYLCTVNLAELRKEYENWRINPQAQEYLDKESLTTMKNENSQQVF